MRNGLSVRDLSYHYGQKKALDRVSFDVAPGRFCALLGPNGAGKSTLIALLTRLLVPPSGEIWIAGHNFDQNSRLALGSMGVVFQQSTLDLDLTVQQNLLYFAALQGIPRATAPAKVEQSLDRLGMRERSGEKVRNLNGGHRRRMELARSLMHEPKVLLLDEPTVGLDAAARHSITKQVHDLANQGLCVLWATHLTDEVADTDDLLVLHAGRILGDGQAGDIRGDMALSDWFLSETCDPA